MFTMVKNHLKRITVPKTWDVKRKKTVFVARPEPSGHPMKDSVSLIMLFREMLGRVKTAKELKYILQNKEVLLNGKKQHSHKASIGLFDVLSIPETKKYYRLIITEKGVLAPLEIDAKEASLIPMKIRNKTMISGGKVQLNFTNGNVLIVDKDTFKTGDTALFDVTAKGIKEHFKAEKGSMVIFTGGKHIGKTANIEEVKEDSFIFKQDEDIFESDTRSSKKYAFVIGKKTPAIKLMK